MEVFLHNSCFMLATQNRAAKALYLFYTYFHIADYLESVDPNKSLPTAFSLSNRHEACEMH